ncbi:unnamed protein product, partial [Heligmosomoides polygyrus]|uniref:PH domain-containing protein n=1 Tax=Heligmosomoides polygyrus TaxID=6339 RepID=A0A183FNY7_HELPZ
IAADGEEQEQWVQRLWSLDSLGITEDHNPNADTEEQGRILANFINISKFIDGYLYVQFSWKEAHPKLQDNKQLAYCRVVNQYKNYDIAILRQTYFIPSIRRTVSKALPTCVTCNKFNAFPFRYPSMSDLPKERVTRSRPFQTVGLDYLGAIPFKSTHTVASKARVCLVTCLATRAVHLEVVLNNTVKEFLLPFRRFLARRERPDLTCSGIFGIRTISQHFVNVTNKEFEGNDPRTSLRTKDKCYSWPMTSSLGGNSHLELSLKFTQEETAQLVPLV